MESTRKPRLAIYWSSSCGGCEIAFVNLHEHLLDVAAKFELFFCPCLVDTKKKDVEALADGELAITFFNGALRTSENVEMAHLLRRKSKLLVAMGACAHTGGIPGLSNLHTRHDHFESVYLDNPSVDNPHGVVPQPLTRVPGGTLHLPVFQDEVNSLAQVVPVDYSIPGCPPEPTQLWNAIQALTSGAPLPAAGSVLGAGESSVCFECARQRSEKKVSGFRRVWEFTPDPHQCLLEQGLMCMGVATRSGCGGLCPAVGMPCIGCYGAPPGVYDQGAKMVALLGSIVDIAPIRELKDEHAIAERVDAVLDTIPDPAGVACKFTLAGRSRATQKRSGADQPSGEEMAA